MFEIEVLSFKRSAYLSVLIVCSDDELPGDTHAIIIVLDVFLFIKESLSTRVNLEPRKGMCEALESMERIHSFNANKLLLISAPSILLSLLLL